MNPRLIINIDRLIYPLYLVTYTLSVWFGKKSNHPSEAHYAVIKMMGIGSITRIFSTFKRQGKDLSKVYFYTSTANKELVKVLDIPHVQFVDFDGLWPFLRSSWACIRHIRKLKPQLMIDLERASNLLGVFRYLSTVNTRTRSISFYDCQTDSEKRNQQRYRLQGRCVQDLIDLASAQLPVRPSTDQQVDLLNLTTGKQEDKILININASNYIPQRRYARKKFASVIESLMAKFPTYDLMLIGVEGERTYVQKMLDEYLDNKDRVENCCGHWTLTELTEHIKSARLLVTNDSGPLHLAAMYATPTVAIWGPTAPTAFGYLESTGMINVVSELDAGGPQFFHPKSKEWASRNKKKQWMQDVTPASVVAACEQLLVSNMQPV